MRLLSLALLLAAAGCSGGRAVALIRVTGSAKAVDHFSVDVTAAGQSSTGNLIGPSQKPFDLPPDQTFSLGFDSAHAGSSVHLIVNAISAAGKPIATGAVTFSIDKGGSASATVDLGGVNNMGDMAMATDGGALPDLTIPGNADLTPTVAIKLVGGESDPNYLVVDETRAQLYWNNRAGGTIVQMNTDGSGRQIVSMGDNLPTGLAIDASAVYWTDQGGTEIRNYSFASGMEAPLVNGVGDGQGIAASGTAVYWTVHGAAAVGFLNLANGNSGSIYGPIMGHTFGPILFAGAHLVFEDTDGNGAAHTASINADGTGYLVLRDANATSLAWDPNSNDIYFTDVSGGNVWFYDSQSVMTTAVAMNQDQPLGIALDASYVYWCNYGDGFVRRSPLRNTDPAKIDTISGGQVTAFGMAVDAGYLYWAIRGDGNNNGAIMKMQKP